MSETQVTPEIKKGKQETKSWNKTIVVLLATLDPLNCDVVSLKIRSITKLTPFVVDPEIDGTDPECLISFSDTDTIVLGNNIQ